MKPNVTRRNFLATAGGAALAATTTTAMKEKCFQPIGFALAVVLGLCAAGCRPTDPAPEAKQAVPKAAGPTEAKTNEVPVTAYYFHGTIRCETCLKIERQTREAIERRFFVEIAEKRLAFKAVNYDKPENAHFLQDYKLPCPSLVVVRHTPAQAAQWKLLGDTWTHVNNPFKFNEYVEGEVEKFLGERK